MKKEFGLRIGSTILAASLAAGCGTSTAETTNPNNSFPASQNIETSSPTEQAETPEKLALQKAIDVWLQSLNTGVQKDEPKQAFDFSHAFYQISTNLENLNAWKQENLPFLLSGQTSQDDKNPLIININGSAYFTDDREPNKAFGAKGLATIQLKGVGVRSVFKDLSPEDKANGIEASGQISIFDEVSYRALVESYTNKKDIDFIKAFLSLPASSSLPPFSQFVNIFTTLDVKVINGNAEASISNTSPLFLPSFGPAGVGSSFYTDKMSSPVNLSNQQECGFNSSCIISNL